MNKENDVGDRHDENDNVPSTSSGGSIKLDQDSDYEPQESDGKDFNQYVDLESGGNMAYPINFMKGCINVLYG